ncbi:3,4-dihydroxy-2-butanone-4-phosphate synthase [Psychromarinibacter sp. C21-152]|uniref:3,4-dihydroxy-2-butanone 4-phosphate synthase n=1 Tax=Psychromarinibacter sediminicola TaxID=3033385 RepID=A0AAE3T8R5_9RHOB|nr:3,4-dihydroxy-2-butanone-4-phosphate synthase [Psychromarinibacter sediminicola]MDF0601700.1 3,4-dihydroxy-2-butanone-4-phosphate synthase [Psychromarinibacter sediminicola]
MPTPQPTDYHEYAEAGSVEKSLSDSIADIEDIISDAREGKMFILVDHEDRENEGDLVIPAQMASPEAINFMATYGKGLICLALTGERLDQLAIPQMVSTNTARKETAFSVSIEARDGITTGISASDRARTIAVAIDPASSSSDLCSPGHVFPLRSRRGGVLVRAGHTEAAVDVSRLAGLQPAGVICEIMNPDGTMARLPELIEFADTHGLKIGTISDLIAYRHRHDSLVEEASQQTVQSRIGGEWTLRIFKDSVKGAEHVVLTKGDPSGPEPILVRTHAVNLLSDVLGVGENAALHGSMRVIAEEDRGIVCLFDQTPSSFLKPDDAGERRVLRDIGLGSQILSSLGVEKMILLSDHAENTYLGMDAFGLEIVEIRRINAT